MTQAKQDLFALLDEQSINYNLKKFDFNRESMTYEVEIDYILDGKYFPVTTSEISIALTAKMIISTCKVIRESFHDVQVFSKSKMSNALSFLL